MKLEKISLGKLKAKTKEEKESLLVEHLTRVFSPYRDRINISNKVFEDEELMEIFLNKYPSNINLCPEKFLSDKEFCEKWITKNKWLIKYISPELKKDRDLGLKAVQINGSMLEHLAVNLKNDKEICMAAISHAPLAFSYIGKEIEDDKSLAIYAMRQSGVNLNEKWGGDKEVVLIAVQQNGLAIKNVSKELQQDIEILRLAVRNKATSIRELNDKIKQKVMSDEHIVLELMKENIEIIEFVDDSLINNIDFVKNLEDLGLYKNIENFQPKYLSSVTLKNNILSIKEVYNIKLREQKLSEQMAKIDKTEEKNKRKRKI